MHMHGVESDPSPRQTGLSSSDPSLPVLFLVSVLSVPEDWLSQWDRSRAWMQVISGSLGRLSNWPFVEHLQGCSTGPIRQGGAQGIQGIHPAIQQRAGQVLMDGRGLTATPAPPPERRGRVATRVPGLERPPHQATEQHKGTAKGSTRY